MTNFGRRVRAAFLYDPNALGTPTVVEHLSCFRLFSKMDVLYVPAVQNSRTLIDFDFFDVVIIHYSIRIALELHLSPHIERALLDFGGLKVLFCQDEYDLTDNVRKFIDDQKIGIFFTVIPPDQIQKVYPRERFQQTQIVNVLTGYAPINSELRSKNWTPLGARPYYIAYRGRALPYWYGDLGREKLIVAQRMHAECKRRQVPADIEWEDSRRIYGGAWYEFTKSARATLITESGSNCFDNDGSIRQNISKYLRCHPYADYEEIRAKFLEGHDGKVLMNQISPRVFEAIACGTILIAFRGRYSGILDMNRHCIVLEKDFSNTDDVFNQLEDVERLEQMRLTAYKDVIESGRYSYNMFVSQVETVIARTLGIDTSQNWGRHVDIENQNSIQSILTLQDAPNLFPYDGIATSRPLRVYTPISVPYSANPGVIIASRILMISIVSAVRFRLQSLALYVPVSVKSRIRRRLPVWISRILFDRV